MNPRYQPPNGDIWAKLKAQYGTDAANKMAIADASPDPYDENEVLSAIIHGPKRDDSFIDALGSQIYNDPFGAPIDQVATILDNTARRAGEGASKVAKNWFTWVIILAAIVGVFFYLGGDSLVRRKLA